MGYGYGIWDIIKAKTQNDTMFEVAVFHAVLEQQFFFNVATSPGRSFIYLLFEFHFSYVLVFITTGEI